MLQTRVFDHPYGSVPCSRHVNGTRSQPQVVQSMLVSSVHQPNASAALYRERPRKCYRLAALVRPRSEVMPGCLSALRQR